MEKHPVESDCPTSDSAPLSPTVDDCNAVRDRDITLVARVLVEHLAFLALFKQCVPQNMLHADSQEMSKRSEMVG